VFVGFLDVGTSCFVKFVGELWGKGCGSGLYVDFVGEFW
jgi:hypothetical protein